AAGRDGGGKRHQARRPRLRQSAAVGLVELYCGEPRLWSRHRQGLLSDSPSPPPRGGRAPGRRRPPPSPPPGRSVARRLSLSAIHFLTHAVLLGTGTIASGPL